MRGTLTQAERRFILAFDDPRLALADLGDDIAAATSRSIELRRYLQL